MSTAGSDRHDVAKASRNISLAIEIITPGDHGAIGPQGECVRGAAPISPGREHDHISRSQRDNCLAEIVPAPSGKHLGIGFIEAALPVTVCELPDAQIDMPDIALEPIYELGRYIGIGQCFRPSEYEVSVPA